MASAQYQFPEDLSNYYMTFLFSEYSRSSVFSEADPLMATGGGVALPMPDSINDKPFVVWGEDRFTEQLGGAAKHLINSFGEDYLKKFPGLGKGLPGLESMAGTAIQLGGYQQGMAINPFLVMLFKEPGFKEFTFSWTLMPRTEKESDTLKDIVKLFRKNMLPQKNQNFAGALLNYPLIVKPAFNPDDYLFKFKYCAVTSCSFDYTPAGQAAFFKNQAPVGVKLDIHLKEIDLWYRDDPAL